MKLYIGAFNIIPLLLKLSKLSICIPITLPLYLFNKGQPGKLSVELQEYFIL